MQRNINTVYLVNTNITNMLKPGNWPMEMGLFANLKNKWNKSWRFVMSKSKRLFGLARIASSVLVWNGFTLKPGAIFGEDQYGFFASFGLPSNKFGIPDAKRNHIIVYRAVNQNKDMPITYRKTVWGANSRAIGRRPVIADSGSYAAPWGYVWQWEQVHINSDLGVKIATARNVWKKTIQA